MRKTSYSSPKLLALAGLAISFACAVPCGEAADLYAARPPRPAPNLIDPGANSQAAVAPPQSPDPGGPLSAVTTSWEGIRSDFTLEPPDPHGAAGPNGIVQVVNVQIAYWDKSGHAIWGPIPLDGMFASVGNRSFSFDPRALYDTLSGRFYVLLLEQDSNNQKSYLNLAVSKTSNPLSGTTNDWFLYHLDNTLTNGLGYHWGDYPGFAFDSRCIYTTVNMYGFTNGYSGQVQIGIIDKVAAQAGNGNINFVYTAPNAGGFTLQPCSVHSPTGPGNLVYLGQTISSDNTHVRIWALNDPLGTPTLNSALVTVPDNGGHPPFGGAPQAGTSITIDPSDGRTQGNAFWYGGAVWFCTTMGGSSGKSVVYYYRVGVNGFPGSPPVLVEAGSIDGGPGEWTYQPSIGVNDRGDVGLVFCQSSTTRFPTIFGTTRVSGAPSFDPPVLIKTSPAYYFGGRWGDYGSVTPDPVDQSFWMTHEFSRSTQVFDWGTWWANVQARDLPLLQLATNIVIGGNGNGVIDFDECNNLFLVLTNVGSLGATNLQANLASLTPGVFISQGHSTYPDMPVGGGGTNLTPYQISTFPTFVCGTPIILSMVLKSDQDTATNQIRLTTGVAGTELRFDNSIPVPIPDGSTAGTNSYMFVTNVATAISHVKVSLFVTHPFDSDLTFQLISPGGVTNTLTAHNGSFGQNYGFNCSPDGQRTTFDDSATLSITAGTPPYLGSYQPQTPLSVFDGSSGTNVNGVWTLRLVDDVAFDVGALQCWSLFMTPATCSDGGGECPGSDLSVAMIGQPEPVVLGNTLTYQIAVTNYGPSSAKNTTVAQVLPSSVIFQGATTSQGGYSQNGGTVTISFGTVPAGGWATATVTVFPTVQDTTISSTATVSSSQPDPVPANNSVTVQNHVSRPTTDLNIGLGAAPEPVVVGGSLTYSIGVTNNGPSDATQVTVTNVLPLSMAILNSGASQGSTSVSSNIVVCSFGSIFSGGRATATINVRPSAQGVYTATARVSGAQLDPFLGNNSATVSSTVLPSADLALTAAASSSSVVIGSNFTYQINIINNGPNPATSVTLNGTFPASLTVVSNYSSHGALNISGGSLTANLGSFVPGEQAAITLVLNSSTNLSFNASFSVGGAEADPNLANNSASINTSVDVPKVVIAAFGVTLTSESFSPTNGAVDIGETVGADFYLSNIGNVNSPLLSATLLSTNGVLTDPSTNTQTLGIFQPGGAPLKAHFTFTAAGTNGGTVTAVVKLLQGVNPATNPPVNFVFGLPNIVTFANTGFIAIRDVTNALPYPSTINISGVTGTVGNVSVTLSNISHGFPQDIDALAAGPSGQDTILMSAAGAPPLQNVNVTFDDRAPTPIPDINGTIVSTSYRPASYGDGSSLAAPAPAGPYPAAMSVFNGANPNGTWSLFVRDTASGDTGSIAGGWSVSLTLISPVNKLADLGLAASTSANPALAGNNLIYTFTVTNSGPDAASNVRFTDVLPAGLTYVSSSTNVSAVGSTVSGNLGSLAAHATATVTITANPGPSLSNPFMNTASVSAFEVDLNTANNTNSVVTGLTVPLSDLSLTLAAATNTVIAGSNVTYSIVVSNAGPGDALNVAVTNILPPGLSSVTVSNPLGTFSVGGGIATASIAKLTVSNSATITIKGTAPGSAGTLTNSASVATASQDTNSANNAASTLVSVVAPAPGIVISGVSLVSESFSPPNGAIDPGETVTVSFALRNAGLVDASSVTATLQASGGVTPVGPAQQNYGSLPAGGAAVANNFSFTANGVNGGTVVATLLITNGSTFLGTVTNAFALPSIASFSNNGAITIPDHGAGSPYPSVITVTNMPGLLSKATVTLNGFTHGFPRDVSALLVSPAGGNVLLMSHAGGPQAVTNPIVLTFDDGASNAVPISGPLVTSTNQPASYFNAISLPLPAPALPYGATLGSLAGKDANGSWKLYVFDDSAGDAGMIGSGWSLQLTTITTINPVADLLVSLVSTPASLFVGGVYTNIITVSNSGPSAATALLVTNSFPFGVSVVSTGTPPAGPLVVGTGGSVSFSAGSLAAGTSTNFYVVLAPAFGSIGLTNVATVSANTSDLNLANNKAQSVVSALVAAPAVLSGSVSNHQFELTILAQANLKYVIEASTNLSTWVSLSTNTASGAGTIKYVDTTTPAPKARYYRTVRVLP